MCLTVRDDRWDEHVPREMALKKAGESSYYYYYCYYYYYNYYYYYQKKNLTVTGQNVKESDKVVVSGGVKKPAMETILCIGAPLNRQRKWKTRLWSSPTSLGSKEWKGKARKRAAQGRRPAPHPLREGVGNCYHHHRWHH